jgi:hypothetical protein
VRVVMVRDEYSNLMSANLKSRYSTVRGKSASDVDKLRTKSSVDRPLKSNKKRLVTPRGPMQSCLFP